jgi:uncharacterized protein YlbG (UPF0298 family)
LAIAFTSIEDKELKSFGDFTYDISASLKQRLDSSTAQIENKDSKPLVAFGDLTYRDKPAKTVMRASLTERRLLYG